MDCLAYSHDAWEFPPPPENLFLSLRSIAFISIFFALFPYSIYNMIRELPYYYLTHVNTHFRRNMRWWSFNTFIFSPFFFIYIIIYKWITKSSAIVAGPPQHRRRHFSEALPDARRHGRCWEKHRWMARRHPNDMGSCGEEKTMNMYM